MKEKIGKIIEEIESKRDPGKSYETVLAVLESIDEMSEMDAVKTFKAFSEYLFKITSYISRLEARNKKLAEELEKRPPKLGITKAPKKEKE